jgi:hydrogenase/urease accessory protein HupE
MLGRLMLPGLRSGQLMLMLLMQLLMVMARQSPWPFESAVLAALHMFQAADHHSSNQCQGCSNNFNKRWLPG